MDKLRATLAREYGPFPLWAWLVIVPAGVLLGRWIRGWSSDNTGDGQAPPAEPERVLIPGAGAGGAMMSGTDRAPTGADQTGRAAPTTNSEWLRAASARIGGSLDNPYSAVDVDTALRRYLAGYSLTARQGAIVNRALELTGPPPESVPAAIVEPPPSSTPPAKPPATPSLTWGSGINSMIRSRYTPAQAVTAGVAPDNQGKINNTAVSSAFGGGTTGIMAAVLREYDRLNLDVTFARLGGLAGEVARGRQITGPPSSIRDGLEAYESNQRRLGYR